MIQCPDCRNMIPDDSIFCDQCGKELRWCPECKRPKRGTECPVCGSDLVPGRKYLAQGAGSPGLETPGTNADKGTPDPVSNATDKRPGVLAGNSMRLVLQAGFFGRRGGIWPELGSCPYVSGNHGVIGGGPSGWTITDSGSMNGTRVNGMKLTPGTPVTLKAGDTVRIATLDFKVE